MKSLKIFFFCEFEYKLGVKWKSMGGVGYEGELGCITKGQMVPRDFPDEPHDV